MLQAVPLEGEPATTTESPEERAKIVLESLDSKIAPASDLALLSDHLSLFRRWYYRPEKQRIGEIFLPTPDGTWPIRRILRGAARMVLGEPKQLPDIQREAAKEAKVRILHEGRPDVERAVPIVEKRSGKRK
jgi:excinuclease ABC subunit C